MSDKADWLAGLKVGDPVIVRWSFPRRREIQTVVRLTDTLIETNDGLRFRRKDGYKPGCSSYHFRLIEQPTAAQARKAER